LFTIHANDTEKLAEARTSTLKAHVFSDFFISVLPLFYD
jgi:hypothetical protein